jgi:hypothetical protein
MYLKAVSVRNVVKSLHIPSESSPLDLDFFLSLEECPFFLSLSLLPRLNFPILPDIASSSDVESWPPAELIMSRVFLLSIFRTSSAVFPPGL